MANYVMKNNIRIYIDVTAMSNITKKSKLLY